MTALGQAGAKPWDGVISEEEQRAYNAAGFGRQTGLGKRELYEAALAAR